MKQAGLKTEIPLIGFVFSGKLANAKPDLIAGFVRSARDAQQIFHGRLQSSAKACSKLPPRRSIARENGRHECRSKP